MKTILTLAAGLLIATSAGASAHGSKYDPDTRQARQLDSIEQGRRDGSITWTEGIKLRKEQREIDAVEAHLRSDGRLSKNDRAILKKMQDEAGQHIREEKTDGRERPAFLPRVGR